MDWIFVFPQNSHVEALTPNVMYLKVGPSEVLKFRCYEYGTFVMALVFLLKENKSEKGHVSTL